MKRLTVLLLFCLCAAQASALDRKPRNLRPAAQAAETETGAEEWQLEEPVQPQSTPQAAETAADSTPEPEPACVIPELSAEQVDSLVAEWRERQRSEAFREFFNTYVLVDSLPAESSVPDSVYTGRLRALASPIQLPYNSIVRSYINRYVAPGGPTIGRTARPAHHRIGTFVHGHFPRRSRRAVAVHALHRTQLRARSQFAGRRTLRPHPFDQGRLPLSERPLPHLQGVVAGHRGLQLRSRQRQQGARGYVPAFIGASYAYSYHRNHGIEPDAAPIPLSVDTLCINRLMHFGQIASTIDIPMETLRQLNPQYKLDIIPATTKTYTLVLPQRKVAQYIAHEQEIMAKDSTYLKEYINPANIDKKRAEMGNTIHTVRSGETLSGIAHKYHISTAQIMRSNKLKNANRLRIGQKLIIERR